jgi:hypothetical protein
MKSSTNFVFKAPNSKNSSHFDDPKGEVADFLRKIKRRSDKIFHLISLVITSEKWKIFSSQKYQCFSKYMQTIGTYRKIK